MAWYVCVMMCGVCGVLFVYYCGGALWRGGDGGKQFWRLAAWPPRRAASPYLGLFDGDIRGVVRAPGAGRCRVVAWCCGGSARPVWSACAAEGRRICVAGRRWWWRRAMWCCVLYHHAEAAVPAVLHTLQEGLACCRPRGACSSTAPPQLWPRAARQLGRGTWSCAARAEISQCSAGPRGSLQHGGGGKLCAGAPPAGHRGTQLVPLPRQHGRGGGVPQRCGAPAGAAAAALP